MSYQDTESINLYLRNILKEHLNYQEKRKLQTTTYPLAIEYIPSSEEVIQNEREFGRYFERVFTALSDLDLTINGPENIKIRINNKYHHPQNIELKKFLEEENINIENLDWVSSPKPEQKTEPPKIKINEDLGDVISRIGKIKRILRGKWKSKK